MYEKLYRKYRYSLILLRELVITDFKLRYQNSLLGYMWALLKPLFTFIIMYVFFVKVLGVGKEIPHWGVALLLGIVMWNFFQEVVHQGLKSITGNGGIIRKINFPKYIIVVSTSLSAVINLIINLIVVAIFAAIDKVAPSWGMLLIPVFIIELYILGVGLAFFLSTFNVRYRDTGYIWDVITQALFYGSAIMFPLNRILGMNHGHALALLASMNPVAQSIQDARYYGITDKVDTVVTLTHNLLIILIPLLVTIVIFIAGALYFRRRAPGFAEDI